MARTFVYIPPVKESAGGVQVLFRLAVALRAAGRESVLAVREPSWRAPGHIPGLAEVPVAAAGATGCGPGDVWLVPEGWPTAMAEGFAGGARVVVYCQNWAYLLSHMPGELMANPGIVSWLAVSQPTAWLMKYALGVDAPVLRPGIDLSLFRQPPEGKELGPGGAVRVAYMPRKNKALAQMIREIAMTRALATGLALEWLEIKDLDLAGVAAMLGRAHIFLATGFPEGCPLPPLEAMACGAIPVGFAGFGGLDYLRQIFPGDFAPWLTLREVPFGGNAVVAADADAVGAALAIERAAGLWREGGEDLAEALRQGRKTANMYDLACFAQNVASIWSNRPWEREIR